MPERVPQFAELHRLLQQAGIIDTSTRRIIEELQDHYCDLVAEAQQCGCDSGQARRRALRTMGSAADIAASAAQRRELLDLPHRYPLLAEFSRGCVCVASVPGLPIAYVAEHCQSIARWGASVGLAGLLTAGFLLSLQTVLGTL